MGCGASNDAKPTPVVPAAVAQDPSKPHRVHVGIPNQAQNGLPPGLASFKNSPQAANGGINSNSNFPNGLAPLKTTPVLGSRTASNNPPSIDLSNVPPGSQIPGLNYCNSDFFPTRTSTPEGLLFAAHRLLSSKRLLLC
jgi:hypothetical protein